jgi:translocation and assembly module TamB
VVTSPVRVELAAASLAAAPRGLLTASASAGGEPLRLAVPFARDERGALRLGPVDGVGAGVQLSGNLSLPPAGGAVLGTLALAAGGGGRPVALAGTRLDGEAEVTVAFGDRNGAQTVEVRGTGRSLALTTPDGPLAAAEGLSLHADLLAAADPEGEGSLSVVRPTVAGVSLAAIDARLTGSPAKGRYEIVARPEGDPAAGVLRAQGTIAQETDGSRLSVASLSGRIGGQAIALHRPLVVTRSGGETVVGELDLSVAGGSVSGSGRTGAAGTDGRIVLNQLPLSLAGAVAPGLNLTGMLNGEGRVVTEGGDFTGRLAVRLSDVRAGPAGGAPALEATAVATIGSGAAALEVRVPSLGGSPLTFDARVPARVDARTLAVEMAEQAPLQGRLVWSGAVARLWELAPFTDQRLTGDADIDLTLAGTVAAPELGGRAALTDGRYEHFLTETVIDGLSLQAVRAGSGGIALTLRGTDGAKGRVRGDGRVMLAEGMAPLVDFVLTFEEATLVRRDDVTAAFSGEIAFRRDRTGAALTGDLISERIEVRLIDRLPPSVVVLDVTEINLPPGHIVTRSAPAADTGAGGPAVALDISVKLPRRVFVRGRGLESEWEGDLRVSGSGADPRLIGVVQVRSGTFDFAGKRFTLETGEIGFTGGATPNPTLNVQAARTTPDLTALIRVTGTALDPEIELSSTPALPESEILSRVLFEKGVAKLGPVEAAQLAMALDTLASGESMSEDALSYVRNLLGLDVLTIEAGEEEGDGPALGVGRYVADGVYVGARQGVAEESTAGTVEIEVLPGLAIESEVSEGAEGATGALGLRWKWDY